MDRRSLLKLFSGVSVAAPVAAGLPFGVGEIKEGEPIVHPDLPPIQHVTAANLQDLVLDIAHEACLLLHSAYWVGRLSGLPKLIAVGGIPDNAIRGDTVTVKINGRPVPIHLDHHHEATILVREVSRLLDPLYRRTMLTPPMEALVDSINRAQGPICMGRLPEILQGTGAVSASVEQGHVAARAIMGYDPASLAQILTLDFLYGQPT
jgi:hypothetical protein